MSKPLSIGFIGNGSHARRVRDALISLEVRYQEVEYDRSSPISEQVGIIQSDAIFITSPNDTHGSYLEQLHQIYNGYIYCEKPPVNRLIELSILDTIDMTRCFFGFNYRYSPIHEEISGIRNEFDLGPIVTIEIHCSYPFAVKPEYLESWKSDCDRSPLGVLENLGVHFIDMSISFAGSIQTSSLRLTNIINNSRAPDTATLSLLHSNGTTSNIFVSYATSYRNNIYLTLERGDIDYDGNKIDVYSPRETFNFQGLSIRPPVVLTKELDSEIAYKESLRECVKYFIQVVASGGEFESELSDRSREVASAMLVSRKI